MGENSYRAKNGVAIYYYPNSALHGFHLSLFLRAGSMHEDESECGVSHFFEHVAIRNVNKLREGKLYHELDRRGVEFNASTYTEMIQFYTSGIASNFEFASGVILDVLSPIVLDSSEISAERSRIKAEIRENDERSSLGAFTNEIVHSGTSLSRPITGTLGGVNKITLKVLEDFRRRTLSAENIFLYASGNVSEGDISTLLTLVGEIPLQKGTFNANTAPVSSYFLKRPRKVHVKNADFTMARFTFDLDMTRLSVAEADLIYDILLGGYDSEFFSELSEKRGLFYDLSGALERYSNIGTLSFSFEVREALLYEAVAEIAMILSRMTRTPLPTERCMRAPYVDNAYLLLDDPRELCFTFAYDNHIMSENYSSIDERIAAYSAVTPERIREVSEMIFKRSSLTFTVKGKKRKIDTERLESALSCLPD